MYFYFLQDGGIKVTYELHWKVLRTNNKWSSWWVRSATMLLRMCLGQWENVFLSPFNIYTALGMVLSGSGNNTKAEMTKAMQLSDCLEHDQVHHEIAQLLNDCSKPSEGVNIILANRLFVAQNVRIKEQFKTNLKTYYDAPTEHVSSCYSLLFFAQRWHLRLT